MSREAAVLLTLLVYNAVLVLIGLLCRGRTRDSVDFYLGGRKLGPLVAAISASASSSSAWTLLGVSGAAYAWGLSAIWLFPACVGGFALNWFVLAPALQRVGTKEQAVTVTEVLAGAPGTPLRDTVNLVCSLVILLSLATYVASQFQGAGKTFSETFGISMTASVLIGSAIVVFYTFLGGFWAVSITDTVQGLLMVATAVLLPISALGAVGGFGGFAEGVGRIADPSFLSLTRNLPITAAIGFILGLLGIGLGYPGQPHVVNRFMALAERPRAISRARLIAISWAVLVYAGMLILGWCGRIIVPNLADPEVVFISLTNLLFHPVMSGIMLAAVLSAIMSTADSQLLVASSSVTHDLRIGHSLHLRELTVSRLVVLLLSAGAVAGALLGSQRIFSQVLFAWAAMGSAFGPLLLVLVLKGEVRPGIRVAAISGGFLLSVGAFYLVPAEHAWKGSLERLFPFLIVLALVLLGTKRRASEDRARGERENARTGEPEREAG
jgi:sodium/proline symporter